MRKVLLSAIAVIALTSSAYADVWHVDRKTSPVDDSKEVYISTSSTTSSSAGALVIRCKEHETDVMVVPGGFGYNGASVKVLVRLDSGQALPDTWNGSTDGQAVFYPGSVPFFSKVLSQHHKFFIRVFASYDGEATDATFDLDGLTEKLPEVADACGWKFK
jgi:type VI secretion system protein VasI